MNSTGTVGKKQVDVTTYQSFLLASYNMIMRLIYDITILQHVNGTKLGTLVLESRGFYPGAHWYWIGVGANAGFMFLFNFIYLMCLTYLDRKFFSTLKDFSILLW